MLTSPRLSFAVLPVLMGLAMSFTFAGSFTTSGGTVVISTSTTGTGEGLPTAEEVLADCLMKFEMILAEADEDITDRVDDTIEEIEYLRDTGAREKRIRKEASNGKKRVQGAGASALAEVNRTYGDCFANLMRRGADREMKFEMNDAMKDTVRDLKRLAFDAYEEIDNARDGVTPVP